MVFAKLNLSKIKRNKKTTPWKFNSKFTPWKVTRKPIRKGLIIFQPIHFQGRAVLLNFGGVLSFHRFHPLTFVVDLYVFVARCGSLQSAQSFFRYQNHQFQCGGCRDWQVRWKYHFFTNTYIGVFIVSTPTSKWNHLFILGFAFKHAMKRSKTLHSAVVCHGR